MNRYCKHNVISTNTAGIDALIQKSAAVPIRIVGESIIRNRVVWKIGDRLYSLHSGIRKIIPSSKIAKT